MAPLQSRGNVRDNADWYCKTCKNKVGKPFENRGHRTSCFGGCGLHKGQSFGGKVAPSQPSVRQIPGKVGANDKDKRIQELEKLLAQANAKVSGTPRSSQEPVPVEEDDASKLASMEFDKLHRAQLFLEKEFGKDSACTIDMAKKAEDAKKRRDETRPVKAQISAAKSRMSNAERKLTSVQDRLSALELALGEAQFAVEEQKRLQQEALQSFEAAKLEYSAVMAKNGLGHNQLSQEDVLSTFLEGLPADVRQDQQYKADIKAVTAATEAFERLKAHAQPSADAEILFNSATQFDEEAEELMQAFLDTAHANHLLVGDDGVGNGQHGATDERSGEAHKQKMRAILKDKAKAVLSKRPAHRGPQLSGGAVKKQCV